jgi:hypothetical protein
VPQRYTLSQKSLILDALAENNNMKWTSLLHDLQKKFENSTEFMAFRGSSERVAAIFQGMRTSEQLRKGLAVILETMHEDPAGVALSWSRKIQEIQRDLLSCNARFVHNEALLLDKSI